VCRHARLGPVLSLIALPLHPANDRDRAGWRGPLKTQQAETGKSSTQDNEKTIGLIRWL